MPISYKDLNPTESEIELNSVTFKLRPFDLRAQTWAYNYFATEKEPNGVFALSERIQNINDISAVLDVVWHLLKGKSHFNNNQKSFDRTVEALGDKKFHKTMQFRVALNECLGVSQPKLEEIKGELELKKSLAAEV